MRHQLFQRFDLFSVQSYATFKISVTKREKFGAEQIPGRVDKNTRDPRVHLIIKYNYQ